MLTLGSNQGLEVKDVNAKPIPPQSESPFLIGVYFGKYVTSWRQLTQGFGVATTVV